MGTRSASIKETGEELSQKDWERFDRAVEKEEAERPKREPYERGAAEHEPADKPSANDHASSRAKDRSED